MKVKDYGEKLLFGKINFKKLTGPLVKFFLGFFFYSAKIFEGYPFAYAINTTASFPVFLGTVFGTFLSGVDVIRTFVAITSVFLISKFLMPRFSFPEYSKAFVSSLWGVLIAEIVGAIFFTYTFYENLLFALSGLLGGVLSLLVTYKKTARLEKKQYTNAYYLVSLFPIAVVLCGMGFSGKILSSTAVILTVFTVLCLAKNSTLFYTLSFAVIVGGAYTVLCKSSVYYFAFLTLGSLVASLMKEWGKFAVPFGFFITDLSFLLYTNFSEISESLLFYTVVSSLLFFFLSEKTKEKFLSLFLSDYPRDGMQKYKVKKVKSGTVTRENAEKLCDKCPKKMTCWLENYNFTSDNFMKIKNGDFSAVSDAFFDACIHSAAIKKSFGLDENKDKIRLEISKISNAKIGEKFCGDTVGSFVCGGKQTVYIVDGMGTGNEAYRQSRKGGSIIKKLADNGISEKESVKILNEYLTREKTETVMGIDLLSVDLKKGIAEFYKAGAAPSYIIRNKSPYSVGTVSVPIGILDEINIEYNKCRLKKDDIIIMISDGLLSSGSEEFEDILLRLKITKEESPVEIAEKIMMSARKTGLVYKDDISIISMKVS